MSNGYVFAHGVYLSPWLSPQSANPRADRAHRAGPRLQVLDNMFQLWHMAEEAANGAETVGFFDENISHEISE